MNKTGIKRIAAVLGIAMVLVMAACPFTYAAGLSLEKITPRDGESGKQVASMAIKMTFSEKMATKENVEANTKNFKIVDAEGKEQKFYPVFDEVKYPNDIWLILQEDLLSDSEYKVIISGDVKSVDGNTLGSEFNSTFKTRNTKTDTTVSMLMTVGMMVIMVVITSKSAKKMQEKEMEEKGIEPALNPYKIAKEKGISVQEAVAYVEKEKAKAAKKKKKVQPVIEEPEEEEPEEEELSPNTYLVKGPRSIKAAGAKVPRSVVRRNKQKREAARLAEERRKANSAGKKKKK